MTLVSGDISFVWIFAEVAQEGGIKQQWGCRQRQFSAFSRDISSETLEMRPTLLYSDTQSIVCFLLIPKCVTLNDLDWLFCVKFCFRAGMAFSDRVTFENNCVKTNKVRHILSAVQMFDSYCSFWQCKVCADVRSGFLVNGVAH